MNNKKNKYLVLGICLLLIVVIGGTAAYITWKSENINYQGGSKCFEIYYDKGTDISGSFFPSDTYTGGKYATVKMNVKSSCNIDAKGIIYLNTLDTTSSNLYREGLLNYQVVQGNTVTDYKGTITSSGEIAIDIGNLTKASRASTTYKIYVWVDNNLVENSDANSSYYGKIRAEAIQLG